MADRCERRREAVSLVATGGDAMSAVLARECADAVTRHRTLRHIIEYPHALGDDESDGGMIRRFGLEGNHHYPFGGDEAYERQVGDLGGWVLFFRDPQGEDFSVVFLRHPADVPPPVVALFNVAVLFHELGHVDDFERRANLVPGRPMNVEEAEYYANAYAFYQLFERRHFLSLAAWMASLEGSIAACGVPAVEAAARRVIAADFYRRPRQLLGDVVRLCGRYFFRTA